MRANTLYEALEILRALKELSTKDFPAGIEWIRVQRAHSQLQTELTLAGLSVPVEFPQEVAV